MHGRCGPQVCWRGFLAVGVVATVSVCACDTNDFVPSDDDAPLAGRGEFVLDASTQSPSVRVFYYVPTVATSQSPVLIVLHGSGRDAQSMRDEWVELADDFGLLVFAPWFTASAFPGGSGYNLGNVYSNGNAPGGAAPKPEGDWAFSVVEPLFDEVKRRTGNTSATYDLFGHSAGGQFAHRFVLFFPDGRYRRVVAANPGWYTVPDPDIDFPYGIGRSPIDGMTAKYFERSLIVMAGDRDTDPSSAGLRHTPEADAQGAHRFERAQYFYDESRRIRAGAAFGWRLVVVDGVGHDGRAMGEAAADLLY